LIRITNKIIALRFTLARKTVTLNIEKNASIAISFHHLAPQQEYLDYSQHKEVEYIDKKCVLGDKYGDRINFFP